MSTLSRVAERIYWTGRYIERAESTARLISVNANLLFDFPKRTTLGWRPLVEIVGAPDGFDERYNAATEQNVVRFLASDSENPGSILSSIENARENARTVRDQMPRFGFELINELYLYAADALTGSLSRLRRAEVLGEITGQVQRLEGFLSANMAHGAPWIFFRLGNHLERADMTTRLIDVRSSDLFADLYESDRDLSPYQEIQWRSVLRSLYGLQTYRAAMGQGLEEDQVLRFLFTDPEFPRSYARCLMSIRTSLRSLARSERPLRSANRILRQLAKVEFDEPIDLHSFVDACQVDLADLHNEIGKTYFYFRPRLTRRKKT